MEKSILHTIAVPKRVLDNYPTTKKDYDRNRRSTTIEDMKEAREIYDDLKEESNYHRDWFKDLLRPDQQVYIS